MNFLKGEKSSKEKKGTSIEIVNACLGHCMIVCLQAVSPKQISPTQQPTHLLCFSQVASSQQDQLPLHVSFLNYFHQLTAMLMSLSSETSSCPNPRAAKASLGSSLPWEADSLGDAELA